MHRARALHGRELNLVREKLDREITRSVLAFFVRRRARDSGVHWDFWPSRRRTSSREPVDFAANWVRASVESSVQ